MLAHFPRPLCDELLYSALARCRDRFGFDCNRTLLRLVFGARQARPRVDLPTHLAEAADRVPGRVLGEGWDIAYRHTLFSFYAPFLGGKRSERLVEAMTSRQSRETRNVVGLNTMRVGQRKFLLGCPECWREDCAAGLERYWRRTHQAPGVLVCPIHIEPLLESEVLATDSPSVQRIVSAEEAQRYKLSKIDMHGLNPKILTCLAQGAQWLLNECQSRPGPVALREAYLTAFAQRGLYRGRCRISGVAKFVRGVVGDSTLEAMGCNLKNDVEFNWISRMVSLSRASRTVQAPIRHLMMMAALGFDAKSFFAAMKHPRPLDQISQPQMIRESVRASRCEAQRASIIGWWSDPEVSVSEMARRLGVATGTIGLFAAKIGLPFPRAGKLGVIRKPEIRVRQPRRQKDHVRKCFLRLKERFPALSQTDLAKKAKGIVSWLQKHDAQWLKEHRPVFPCKGGNPGIDWRHRDDKLALRLQPAVKALDVRGARISLSSVGREIGFRLVNFHHRLPKTKALFDLLAKSRK